MLRPSASFRGLRLVLGLALLLVPLATADADVADAVAKARAERIQRLETIATTAHKGGMYGTRDDIYEAIILLDADHAVARKWLKYRNKKGTWERRGKYKRPPDRPKKDTAEVVAAARTEHAAWWQASLLDLWKQAHEKGPADLAESLRQEALVLVPDHEELRAAGGEVSIQRGSKKIWVMPHTRDGLARRQALLDAARAAVRALPKAESVGIETIEKHEGVTWERAIQGAGVRVVGGAGEEEMARIYEVVASAPKVFEAVFGAACRYPSGSGQYSGAYPIYAAKDRDQGDAYVRGEPGVTERDLAYLLRLNSSYLVKRPGIVLKGRDAERRLEGASRLANGLFEAQHLGMHSRSKGAWALQAVQHYLAWLQVRTRKQFLARDVRGAKYGEEEPDVPDWKSRVKGTSDWHALAAEALRSMELADIHLLFGKDVNQLDTRDVLAGYGFVVFAIEVHGKTAARFLRAVADPTASDLDKIFEKYLGGSPKQLLPHLLKWLDEMAAHATEPGPPR